MQRSCRNASDSNKELAPAGKQESYESCDARQKVRDCRGSPTFWRLQPDLLDFRNLRHTLPTASRPAIILAIACLASEDQVLQRGAGVVCNSTRAYGLQDKTLAERGVYLKDHLLWSLKLAILPKPLCHQLMQNNWQHRLARLSGAAACCKLTGPYHSSWQWV